MDMLENLTLSMGQLYGEATKTAVGFFWKSGWAFVFGYTISAMMQAFVPKQKLDDTFWLNLPSIAIVGTMLVLRRCHQRIHDRGDHPMDHGSEGFSLKRIAAMACLVILTGGLGALYLSA